MCVSLCLTNAYIHASAVTTTTIGSICPKCGIIARSGRRSCCGRDGSWFRNCGSAGNGKKLHHTWYEGIQACKTRAQSKRAIGRHANVAQQLNLSNVAATTTPTASVNVTAIVTTTNETQNSKQESTSSDWILQGV